MRSLVLQSQPLASLWGGAALKPGEKGVVLRGNKIVLSEKSPLRRLWTTKARQKEVTVHDFTDAPEAPFKMPMY